MGYTKAQKDYARDVNKQMEARGLTELVQAFRQIDKETKKQIQKELREIAKPAATRAQEIAARLLQPLTMAHQRTIKGIRPGSRAGMAIVRQICKGTTHDHPKFGSWQIANILEPAAEQTLPEAKERLEAMMVRLASDFNHS